ncbi:cyclase family protein [Caloranaerobacter sp. TR13]|uniref:cyclase family protein n=1 Tax=Caloranaerobacter sp. TR13 TaxID=1302151 RepID=UPI0006D3B08A|nr:cyclase family protein [Caloranaerobacter sp. TR13]
MTNSETFIDEIALDTFIGKGCLLDVRNENVITYKEEYSDMVSENDIVLLYTNHSDKYGTEEYFTNYPIVDKELPDFFIEKKIKMLGIDLPSPDKYPFKIHKMLFNYNILIVENMTNLSELLPIKSFEIIAFPLK